MRNSPIEALDTNTAARLLEIWRSACNSTVRDPFVGLEDRVHAEVLSILAEHANDDEPKPNKQRGWGRLSVPRDDLRDTTTQLRPATGTRVTDADLRGCV